MGNGKKRRKRRMSRRFRRFLLSQFILQFSAICAILYFLNRQNIKDFILEVQELQKEAVRLTFDVAECDFRLSQPGEAYADDGTIIATWKGSTDSYFVPLSAIPEPVVDAMITMEDRCFYEHKGVDYKALFRALYALVINRGEIKQGGSTITMQLARTKYLTQEVTWQRKLEEIFVAKELEKKFSKEQILEFYLNNIYFGNGYYGIGAASRGYFGKNVWELNLEQLVFLCAIPNNPTIYNPRTNFVNTNRRKSLILQVMKEAGKITDEEYATANSLDITLVEPKIIEKNNYLESYVTYCAVRELMKYNGFEFCYDFASEEERKIYDKSYADHYAMCQNLLYSEGYSIYTSLDLSVQMKLQGAIDQELQDNTEVDENGVYLFQGAAVCIDNASSYVKAIVGGRSQNYEFTSLNRGYQSFRQPGSSIKPLIVYTPLFERGYTANTMVNDRPIADGPKNATGTYQGEITVRYAVEQSINTVAWLLFEELTPEVGIDYLLKMEFSKIVPRDYAPATAIGGMTIGVSPLEMASAYATIQNDGIFRSPSCIKRIEDVDGNVIYNGERRTEMVYTPEAADMMEDILVSVMQNGTAKPINMENVFCAGKTGTTDACKDSWFIGYTPEYTTSVWVGYDIPKEMEGIHGPSYSGFIWKHFMDEMYKSINMQNRN